MVCLYRASPLPWGLGVGSPDSPESLLSSGPRAQRSEWALGNQGMLVLPLCGGGRAVRGGLYWGAGGGQGHWHFGST